MSVFKVTFADGTVLDGLTKNGSSFISQTEIDSGILTPEALASVKVEETDEGGNTETEIITNARFDRVLHDADGWYLALWGEDPQEKIIRELREQNDMLTECVLEMSEIVYGGEL